MGHVTVRTRIATGSGTRPQISGTALEMQKRKLFCENIRHVTLLGSWFMSTEGASSTFSGQQNSWSPHLYRSRNSRSPSLAEEDRRELQKLTKCHQKVLKCNQTPTEQLTRRPISVLRRGRDIPPQGGRSRRNFELQKHTLLHIHLPNIKMLTISRSLTHPKPTGPLLPEC